MEILSGRERTVLAKEALLDILARSTCSSSLDGNMEGGAER